MISFKKACLPLIVFGLLAGCVKADKNKDTSANDELREYSLNASLIDYNNRALFEAGNIILENHKFSKKSRSDWKEADHLQLWFKLCGLKDRAAQGTIRNEKFHISSELGSNITWKKENDGVPITNPVTVTSEQCLEWSQTIPYFNNLAPSVNVVLHYEIKSLSGNLGTIVKRVGLNPWDMLRNKSQTRGVMDLTNKARADWGTGTWIVGTEPVVASLKGQGLDHKLKLQMDGLSIEPSEDDMGRINKYSERFAKMTPKEQEVEKRNREAHLAQTGIKMKINLKAEPFLRMEDSTGIVHPKIPLTSGKFKVYMTLLATGATNDKQYYKLTESVYQGNDPSKGEVVNNSHSSWEVGANGLIAEVPMALKLDSNYGRVKLAVKIVPETLKENVEPFEAVYDLGEHNQWVRRQTPPFSLENADYNEILNGASTPAGNAATMREAELFYFSILKLRFVRIMPGETATDRTLQYSATTCVAHGLYGTEVGPGLQFDITTFDKPGPGAPDPRGHKYTIRRQTNEDGCLTWFGFLSHKYYHKEVLEKKTADVKFVGTYSQQGEYQETSEWKDFINQYDKQFVYYMNPWDEKWTFGWDERDMPTGYAEEIEEQKKTAPATKLFVADFKYETMGFRYEIDKYMNLKVKKAVLLKLYPYVLKYNSIVLGRKGTEYLRDGVYLMKVALQKDYLDPAAKGVRIYDRRNVTDFTYQEEPILQGQAASHPVAEYQGRPIGTRYDKNGEATRDGLVSPRELGEGKKEYISIQKKLVRVLGGTIITPVEFEVNDLRLMRIRNQFFIQLQTIDEHKLRLASILDKTLSEMQQEGEILEKYQKVFEGLDSLQDIEENEQIQSQLTNMMTELEKSELLTQLNNLNGMTREKAEQIIYKALGIDDVDFDSTTFQQRKQYIANKLAEINYYRSLGFTAKDRHSNAAQTREREEKRNLIDNLLRRYGSRAEDVMNTNWTEDRDKEYLDSIGNDPFQRYFYLGASSDYNVTMRRVLDYHIEKELKKFNITMEEVDRIRDKEVSSLSRDEREILARVKEFETLRSADFTESPLAPNFDLDLLLNDGLEPHQSGLPSRTFVGPLTFVRNTNGSSMRPTDILEELYCATATCAEIARLENNFNGNSQPVVEETPWNEGKNVDPIPPISQPRVTGLPTGNLGATGDAPVYSSGDSPNFKNETNPYYGSLREYAYRTFEDDPDTEGSNGLTRDSTKLQADYTRKMEAGSQIINFVKTLGLRHVVLNQDKRTNGRSILKDIDHECVWSEPVNKIHSKCFTPSKDKRHKISRTEMDNLLNKRKGPVNFHKGASFVRDENEGAYWPDGARSHMGGMRDFIEKGTEVTDQDLVSVMTWGIRGFARNLTDKEVEKEKAKLERDQVWPIDKNRSRLMTHRMCYALSQKFFSKSYFERKPPGRFSLTGAGLGMGPEEYNKRVVWELEQLCHKYTDNYYEDPNYVEKDFDTKIFPPVIFERKARVYKTTGRYVYRGGKSLNINLSASFGLSHNEGFNSSQTISFKPWDLLEDALSTVSKLAKSIVGGLGFTVSYSKNEGMTRSDGTTVSSGTFLVSQEASFVVELGDHERCLVARFQPKMIKQFIESSKFLKEEFDAESDVDTQGYMICEGRVRRDSLPVNETYYYFTQHFTEGDMLDTADLHNHPWLLQLRGFRDFQTFVSMIGAREVRYLDEGLIQSTYDNVKTDLEAMNQANRNEAPEMELLNQKENMRWPLEELGRVYFNVLPTFPGLYTFIDGQNRTPDWPYDNTDPGEALDASDQE